MSCPEAFYWKEVIDSEINSIMNSHIWELLNLPPISKSLGHKWIFKRKMKIDETINKYKGRFIVKGFRQQDRVDYFDTYLLVSRITFI